MLSAAAFAYGCFHAAWFIRTNPSLGKSVGTAGLHIAVIALLSAALRMSSAPLLRGDIRLADALILISLGMGMTITTIAIALLLRTDKTTRERGFGMSALIGPALVVLAGVLLLVGALHLP